MARVLVTGGAGFIGSHVAAAHLRRGDEVVVLDSLATGRRENIPEGAHFVQADIRDPEAAALVREGGFTLVSHHAAQMDVRVSVADSRGDAGTNIDGLLNLAAAAVAGRVPRFLFASSGGTVYGEPPRCPIPEDAPRLPISPYGVSKLAGEHYLFYHHRVHGLDYVALRYGNVYGPRQDPHGEAGVVAIFSQRLLAGTPLTVFGDGEQTRDYVHVDDVVDAALRAAALPLPEANALEDRAFNVGTGRETSIHALVVALEEASGRRAEVRYAPARPGELRRNSLDSARLEALGWTRRRELVEGLRETFAWVERDLAARAG